MQIKTISSDPLSLYKPQNVKDDRPGFADALKDSMKDVNQMQIKAHSAMEELSTGKSNNLHETMIAIQKAEISFKMLAQVRNKVVSAYQEVMRMSV
jgi:flagellar hook-basal body complex protein FliE